MAMAILERFPFGFHIDVDGIPEMVISGLASPLEWTDETARQFDLAIDGSATLAAVYSRAGFAVAIEGALEPAAVDRAMTKAAIVDRRVPIVLHPPLEVALERNRQRQTKSFDTSILESVMRQIDADLARDGERPGWHRLDNGAEPVQVTVERVLSLAR